MLGFSLSPGGLLLPYHLGALAALEHHGYLTPETHLAGSSAGSIAVASHAAQVSPAVALDAAIRVSRQCNPFYLAGGKLLPTLRHELESILPVDADRIINERPGAVGLAYLELFPRLRPRLQTQAFRDRDDIIEAVCDSSMFPYFTSNTPFHIVRPAGQNQMPRIVVDGVFTEPLWRFGCPNLDSLVTKDDDSLAEDRTVMISVFPKELVAGMELLGPRGRNNVISPQLDECNILGQVTRLGLLACSPASSSSLIRLYEDGWSNVEDWIRKEERLRP